MTPSECTKILLPKPQEFWNELLIHHELEQGLAQTCKGLRETECELTKVQWGKWIHDNIILK